MNERSLMVIRINGQTHQLPSEATLLDAIERIHRAAAAAVIRFRPFVDHGDGKAEVAGVIDLDESSSSLIRWHR